MAAAKSGAVRPRENHEEENAVGLKWPNCRSLAALGMTTSLN